MTQLTAPPTYIYVPQPIGATIPRDWRNHTFRPGMVLRAISSVAPHRCTFVDWLDDGRALVSFGDGHTAIVHPADYLPLAFS